MSYQTRNWIVLTAILAIIWLVGGYQVFFAYPQKNRALQKDIGQFDKRIQAMDGIEGEFIGLQGMVEEQAARLKTVKKDFSTRIAAVDLYEYLTDIVRRAGDIEVNLKYLGEEQLDKYGYSRFRIEGEGTFARVNNMVRMLEKGPLVNRIRKLSIRSLEERDPDSKDNRVQIPFNMELWTYFSNFDSLPTQPVNLKDVELAGANSPFNPLVRRNLPPNTQNLLEVERANLQAIVAGRALVADAVGKIHEVSAGSEVYLGYVTEINPEQGFVEFTINKGGLVEKVRLSLKFNR